MEHIPPNVQCTTRYGPRIPAQSQICEVLLDRMPVLTTSQLFGKFGLPEAEIGLPQLFFDREWLFQPSILIGGIL